MTEGTYIGNVIASDWTSGREYYSNNISITVTPSGYTVSVEGGTSPPTVGLASIVAGDTAEFAVSVQRWTDYTNDLGLNWKPVSEPVPGAFSKIEVWFAPVWGRPDPVFDSKMYIKVHEDAPTGHYEMDICVFDGALGREFYCRVSFEVPTPP